MIRYCIALLLITLLSACSGPFEIRKTEWTKNEVQEWYAEYLDTEPELQKGILYEGSDARYHHFSAHMITVDNWAIISIPREELTLAKEITYQGASSQAPDSYFVNPANEFAPVEVP